MSDDVATEALLNFLDAVEAGVASAKQLIGNKKRVTPHSNYNELQWIKKEGTKGEYQQCSRQNSKVEVFDRLQAELKAHGNFWQHGGYRYWFHQNDENVIDRRKK